MNFKFALRPSAEEVFGSLRKATGVPLSLAAQTEKGTATFGSTAVFNVPAWKVMQQLAATQVTVASAWQTGMPRGSKIS